MDKIIIKPIKKERWHKRSPEKTLFAPKVIRATVDPLSLKYRTGLNYTDKDHQDPNSNKKITEAEYYSIKLGIDLNNNYSHVEPHPTWDGPFGKIKLENKPMILDLSIPRDYVMYKLIKNNPIVASSQEEYDNGNFRDAEFVIINDVKELEKKAKAIDLRNLINIELSKISKHKKIAIIAVMSASKDISSARILRGESDEIITVALDELLNSDPETLLELIREDDEYIETYYLVIEAIYKSVLKKEGHRIKYHDSVIGEDIMEAVKYLNNVENQEFKIRIKAQTTN